MEELIWQEHTFLLEKQPGVGFGIAVSGGRDNPGQASGDTSIIISDVVKVGPAFDRVKVNDIVLRVNGKPMFNMSHQQAVRELKNSGSRVELTIKRKVMVRVGRETPPPGPLRRSRSRDLDTMGRRHRSRSRASYRSRSSSRHRPRHRSRSRDLDSSPRHRRRHRSRSRDLSRSRSRTPPRSIRRGRSYSRSPSHHSSHHRRRSPSIDSRSPSPPPQRRGRSRSRTPPPRRRSTSRSWSRSPSEHSAPRRDVTPPRANPPRHKSTEHLVRPSSPLSPDPDSATSDGDMMVFPVKNREPSTVVLKKTRWNNSYGLKLGTRIFIQDIQPGSLADKSSEISAGDTILMINGRNVDNKSVQEAIQIIGLSKDKVTMLVKKQDGGTVSIPADRFRTGAQDADPPATSGGAKVETESDGDSFDESEPPSRRSSVSKHSAKHSTKPPTPEPQPVAPKRGAGEKKQFGGVRVLPSGAAAPGAPSVSSHSSRDTPKQSSVKGGETREYAEPPADDDDDEPGPAVLPPTAREIEFAKAKNVGIRLAGGNDVGIFVASVLESSAAAKKGLKMGDQILSVNGVNFRNIIREEAVLTLMGLPTGEFVHIVAQPQPKVYQKILEHGTGDSFYIRTHFKYERNGDHEMSFKQGSTFRISDTLYQGMVGYWLAARIGRNNMEIERGVIPNRSRAEQLKMVQDRKMTQMRERNRGGIGRRIMKNQKTEGNLSTSSASSMFPAYERVVLREAGFKRPVVVFGPLADIARERLAGDHSDLYEVARNEGMVSGQKSNRKGVIRLNTIKDIIEKDKHAILDITPTAVEKLNYAQLYPIVVFLEPQSKSAVKELRQRLACTDEEKKKKPGKLFDRAVKMQRGYNHVFTDTIQLAAGSDDWYRRLYSTIKDQQSMPVWVSEDKLGGTGEEDTEGVTVPGDDDQFSYVSAPASDYSVTTAGSDFLNSSMRSEDDVTKPRDNPEVVPRQSAAESSEEEDDGGTAFKDDDFDDALDGLEDEPPLDKPVPPHLPAAESPLPLAPPREKKLSRPATSSSSSEDSEEEPPVEVPPVIVPKPSGQRPIRGKQEIPPGRFDPQSFLKNHIQALNKIPRESPQPQQESPPAPRVVEAAQQQAPPPRQPSPEPPRPEPQVAPTPTAAVEPVYAQVNKNRPQPSGHTASPGGRDYAGEIDSFISSDPYRNRPHPSRTQPLNEEPPSRYTNKPAQPYNRFAGISQPKPYNSGRPQGYQPVSNGPTSQQPPKSKFVQEKYKDYMSQIKPSSSGYPRPYSKPGAPSAGAAPVMNRNGGLKENMYDSGVDTYDNAKPKKQEPPPPANPAPVDPVDDEDPQVVATARGVFDSNGGVLSSVETGVSIVIPKGAIRPGVRQEIYFKVCRDNTALPPLDKDKGETLLSPLVMCGPHGLQFDHPVELRLPHCEPSQWQNVNQPGGDNYDVGSNSVSVLIDHF